MLMLGGLVKKWKASTTKTLIPIPFSLNHRQPVSGTPKGKARLKTLAGLKKKSFVQNKKGIVGSSKVHGGVGPPLPKTRPIILRLNALLRRRESSRENLGLLSKLRKRDLDIQNSRSEAAKASARTADAGLTGVDGMSLVELGFIQDRVKDYRFGIEDGRRLAKEYSKLLMGWDRERQMKERGLMELRKAAIEALPHNLRKAALMPLLKKNTTNVVEEKVGVVGKGKKKKKKMMMMTGAGKTKKPVFVKAKKG